MTQEQFNSATFVSVDAEGQFVAKSHSADVHSDDLALEFVIAASRAACVMRGRDALIFLIDPELGVVAEVGEVTCRGQLKLPDEWTQVDIWRVVRTEMQ